MSKHTVREGKLSELTPDDKNANKGTEYGQSLLEKSLRQLGAGRSVLVDKNNRLIAGNKTAETAVAIGIEKTIVVETDGNSIVVVKRTDIDLDSAQGRQLALADNKVSQVNLSFDADVVGSLGKEQDFDITDWGFKSITDVTDEESETKTSKKKESMTFDLSPGRAERLLKAMETAKHENEISDEDKDADTLALMVLVNEYLSRRS